MLTVNKILSQGRGLAPALRQRASTIVLDWDTRQKSRFDTLDSLGRSLGVFLPRGTAVRGGDVLVAEDGSMVVVHAAPQPVLVVRPCADHGSPFDLLRAAYHLGNRHVQLELQTDHLKLEPDHVLAEMLRAMHLIVTEDHTAFEPESGAYAAGGAHGHGHGHDHDAHDHGRADQHVPGAAAARGKPVAIAVKAAPIAHVHGPGCGHGPGHDHGNSGDHHP